jgi:hypothetical protein
MDRSLLLLILPTLLLLLPSSYCSSTRSSVGADAALAAGDDAEDLNLKTLLLLLPVIESPKMKFIRSEEANIHGMLVMCCCLFITKCLCLRYGFDDGVFGQTTDDDDCDDSNDFILLDS